MNKKKKQRQDERVMEELSDGVDFGGGYEMPHLWDLLDDLHALAQLKHSDVSIAEDAIEEIKRLRSELEAEKSKYATCPGCLAKYESHKQGCGYCEAERVQGAVLELKAKLEKSAVEVFQLRIDLKWSKTRNEINDAVNASCTCGGRGPQDEGVCPACQVWHRLGFTW